MKYHHKKRHSTQISESTQMKPMETRSMFSFQNKVKNDELKEGTGKCISL